MQDDSATQSLLEQGLELMIYGMGTVFVFLAVLVLVTTAMSMIVQRFFPEPLAPVTPSTPVVAVSNNNNEQLIAIISAAVHKYRSRQK